MADCLEGQVADLYRNCKFVHLQFLDLCYLVNDNLQVNTLSVGYICAEYHKHVNFSFF